MFELSAESKRVGWAAAVVAVLLLFPNAATAQDVDLEEWYAAWEERDLEYHYVDDWWFDSGTDEDAFWTSLLDAMLERYPCTGDRDSWCVSKTSAPQLMVSDPTPSTTTPPPPSTTTTKPPATTTTRPKTTTTKPPATTTTTKPPAPTTTVPTGDPFYVPPGTNTAYGWPVNSEQWRPLVSQFFTGADIDIAVCIIGKESGGNRYAINPTSLVSGLFQHQRSAWVARAKSAGYPGASIFNAEANIAAAAYLRYHTSKGWGHWNGAGPASCY